MATYNWNQQCCKGQLGKLAVLKLVNSLIISGIIAISCGQSVLAQIAPDATLGAESSVNNNNIIEGGARHGTNLFHSFLEFNVGEAQQVYFANPVGVENILSRVTGNNSSKILGKLGVNGGANLFLLNPNGIVFGPSASLDLRGSFIASTASRINFADGTQFSATNPESNQLLTISVPIGLQFGESAGPIINRSQASPSSVTNLNDQPIGLQVQLSRTLALIGSGVRLENGNLTASGEILENGELTTVSDLTARGGRIEIGSVAGASVVSLIPTGQGWSLGYEGVQNFEDILLQGSFVDVSGSGGGEVQLQGKQVTLDNSYINSITLGEDGGDIIIKGSQLLLQNNSFVTTILSEGEGRGGNLFVNASDLVKVSDKANLLTKTFDIGAAGDLNIETGQLILQDGGQASASTEGDGAGGNVTVNALESVEVNGIAADDLSLGGLFAQAISGEGAGGNLTINTRRLTVRDGARVSVGTLANSTGRGGNLVVNASDAVELIGTGTNTEGQATPSSLFAASEGVGNAGSLTVKTDKLIVRDRATLNVSSQGSGNTGNLEIQAGSTRLENKGKLTATSESGIGGGNITLKDLNLLLLRGNSEISTNAGGAGNGGNINIDTDLLVGTENSDITATAVRGRGGNIQISTQGIFGIEPRSQRTEESDITASSELGVDGVVEINRPDFDPTAELVALPANIVDVSSLVASSCSAGGGNLAREGSEFVVSGRGGLPPNPAEATRSDTALVDLGTPVQGEENRASAEMPSNNFISSNTSSDSTTLVEASGWMVNNKGEVVLTANVPTATSDIPWLTPTSCHGS
jgi:filamentous hemagglutinin family protein